MISANVKWNILINTKPGFSDKLMDRLETPEAKTGLMIFDGLNKESESVIVERLLQKEDKVRNVFFVLCDDRKEQNALASFIKKNNILSKTRLVGISPNGFTRDEVDLYDNFHTTNGESCDLAFIIENLNYNNIEKDPYYKASYRRKVSVDVDIEFVQFDRKTIKVRTYSNFETGSMIRISSELPSECFKTNQFLVLGCDEDKSSEKKTYTLKPMMIERENVGDSADIPDTDERHGKFFQANKWYTHWISSFTYNEEVKSLSISRDVEELRSMHLEKSGFNSRSILMPAVGSKLRVDGDVIKTHRPNVIFLSDTDCDVQEVFDIIFSIDELCTKIEKYTPTMVLFSSRIPKNSFSNTTSAIPNVIISDKRPSALSIGLVVDQMVSNMKSRRLESVKRSLRQKNVAITAHNLYKVVQYSFTPKRSEILAWGSIKTQCDVVSLSEMQVTLVFPSGQVPPKNCSFGLFGLNVELKRGFTAGREYVVDRDGNKATYFINNLNAQEKERLRVIINQVSDGQGGARLDHGPDEKITEEFLEQVA